MNVSPAAGKPATASILVNVPRLVTAYYTEAPATPEQKELLAKLSPRQVTSTELAGEKIQTILTRAPGNGAPIGGLKVIAESGWFAARPSGTENIYKIYGESFRGSEHLGRILEEAQMIVNDALVASPQRPEISR